MQKAPRRLENKCQENKEMDKDGRIFQPRSRGLDFQNLNFLLSQVQYMFANERSSLVVECLDSRHKASVSFMIIKSVSIIVSTFVYLCNRILWDYL